MVAKGRLVNQIDRERPRGFDPDHAGGWAKMVDQAIGPREPGKGHDLLVIDPFAQEARLVGMGDMPFARDRAESQIGRHEFLSRVRSDQGWATTRLRRVPSRWIASSTTSPGLSQPPTAWGVSSRMQPEPTVPEPSTSPGRRVVSRLACARS